MEHEFTHNPIIVKYIDIKTGKSKKTYVFVGDVPDDIKKELNKKKPSAKLKKFYGSKWESRLGLAKTGARALNFQS